MQSNRERPQPASKEGVNESEKIQNILPYRKDECEFPTIGMVALFLLAFGYIALCESGLIA